jgi:hypothetical protein
MKTPPVFYCQLDYADRPYPGPGGRGTIADNGCGPCCASMVAENLTDASFPPWEACRMAIDCGAREKPGTDLYIFPPSLLRPSVSACRSQRTLRTPSVFSVKSADW